MDDVDENGEFIFTAESIVCDLSDSGLKVLPTASIPCAGSPLAINDHATLPNGRYA
jgi:hypothetical protein